MSFNATAGNPMLYKIKQLGNKLHFEKYKLVKKVLIYLNKKYHLKLSLLET